MRSKQTSAAAEEAFAPLHATNVALLTTFRRNGQGVGTPVGIQMADGKVYFTTWSTTGKVKRLANNPRVTLAPFTKMGMKVVGPTVAGSARRLEQVEAEQASASMFKKSLWGRLWGQIYKLRGWQPVLYEVSPVAAGPIERSAQTATE